MTTAMEKTLWARQKQAVVQGFIDERKKLVSTVAGRGFLLAPGFLYEFETSLEVDTKQKLSEVSYKILSDAIDRDIKQSGIDYDLAFKTAAMAWELDKQALLTDWDKEIAGIKQLQAMKEEELSQLAIEVSLRGAALIDAKTVIDIQMEDLRGQLAAIEDDAADYEAQLVQQKLVTARKKLEVIPILQQILAVEQQIIAEEEQIIAREGELVAAERDKTGYMTTLVDAQVDIAGQKQLYLIPAMQGLVDASKNLTVATLDELQFELKIMEHKVIDAGIMVEKAEKQLLISGSQLDAENARLDLLKAKLALAEAQRGHELALYNLDTANTLAITQADNDSHQTVMNQERETQTEVVNTKTDIATAEYGQKVLSSDDITTNDIENIAATANAHYVATVRTAEISASANITANLTHLIG